MTEKYYKAVDIMFLQEAGTVEWTQAEGYTYIKNHDSMIVYRTELFGKEDKNRSQQWSSILDVNKDTAIVITEDNYLLVSSHFSSKTTEYYQNEAILFKGIEEIMGFSEQNKKLKIIIGMDANHFIQEIKL